MVTLNEPIEIELHHQPHSVIHYLDPVAAIPGGIQERTIPTENCDDPDRKCSKEEVGYCCICTELQKLIGECRISTYHCLLRDAEEYQVYKPGYQDVNQGIEGDDDWLKPMS